MWLFTPTTCGTAARLSTAYGSAVVTVGSDPDLEQTTIIGKVFNDLDGDGWQDNATATGISLLTVAFIAAPFAALPTVQSGSTACLALLVTLFWIVTCRRGRC